jgi:hypothetical protein
VNTTAFRRLWSDFVKAPTEKWVAAVGSVAAVIAYVALLILLYLFVDLLVWKGHIPSYAQLPAAKKQEFAAEWGGRPETDRTDSVKRLGLPDPGPSSLLCLAAEKVGAKTETISIAAAGFCSARCRAVYVRLADGASGDIEARRIAPGSRIYQSPCNHRILGHVPAVLACGSVSFYLRICDRVFSGFERLLHLCLPIRRFFRGRG